MTEKRAPEDHWSAMVKIVEGGLEGNPEKVRAYTELLLGVLEADQREAQTLRRLLEGGGNLLYPANSESQEIGEEVRQALLRLTALRKRVKEANDTIGRLFAPLLEKTDPPPGQSDLDQAVKDLEGQVPGYYVWYEPRHTRYVLVPKTDQEL